MEDFLKLQVETEIKNISEQFIAAEFARLKTLEEEHKRLISLIELIVKQNIIDESVTIKISKKHQMLGKEWKDILQMAFDEKEFQSHQPAVVKSESESTNS